MDLNNAGFYLSKYCVAMSNAAIERYRRYKKLLGSKDYPPENLTSYVPLNC